jgi:hypothetical protein
MSKPVTLFVPGSFSPVSEYPVPLDGVSGACHEIKGIHLPTVRHSSQQGRDVPASSMYNDTSMIAQEARNLTYQGKDVILVRHSYTYVPMSQSTNE